MTSWLLTTYAMIAVGIGIGMYIAFQRDMLGCFLVGACVSWGICAFMWLEYLQDVISFL